MRTKAILSLGVRFRVTITVRDKGLVVRVRVSAMVRFRGWGK